MKRFLLLPLLSLFLVPQAQTAKPVPHTVTAAAPAAAGMSAERLARIDEAANQWVREGATNGCVALIIRDGKVVYHKAFGYNDEAKRQPLRTDDIFRIASQSKAITSVAAMMLYEEGKFQLDDPVSKYIPEFKGTPVLDKFNAKDTTFTTIPAKSDVTVRQLLTHTSGLGYAQIGSAESNAIYAKAGLVDGFGGQQGHLLATDMKKLGALPLMHQPGEKFTYGLNSDLLGYLVEVWSGMSLDQFFRKRIFDPLGMNDTWFYLPSSKQGRLVNVFTQKDGKLETVKGPVDQSGAMKTFEYPKSQGTYFSGGAGLSSTAMDYAVFLQMLLNGGEYNGKRLLARNTVRMMTMNQIGDLSLGANKFGLGFQITTEKGSGALPEQEGSFEWGGAFTTTYWADPKERLVGIFYRQHFRVGDPGLSAKFKVLTYSAIND
jgi:CubicO group peptidase (beta-lactamase class C family)